MIEKFKKQIEKIDKPLRLYFYFSIFDTLVGIVGMIVYGILTVADGAIWIRNQYIGLWLLTLLTITGFVSLYLETKHFKFKSQSFYFDVFFFVSATILTFLLSLFFGLGSKIDATIWSVWICAVNITNCYLLYLRSKDSNHKLQSLQQSDILDSDENRNELELSSIIVDTEKDRHNKNHLAISIIIIILKILYLILVCFILNGAITVGAGKVRYEVRGKFLNVKLNDGTNREYKIHVLCDGPATLSPVFMFESGVGHSMADFLILQKLLKENNRRSCIWDKPGAGYSDYLYTDAKNYSSFYHNFIVKLNESSPFVFVGWGQGGQIIYDYASDHPEMVKSLVFLDVSPIDIEFKIPYIINNWSLNQLENYKEKEVNKKIRSVNWKNGLAVPWGLMNYYVPEKNGNYQDLLSEARWNLLTEKIWSTQAHFLKFLKKEDDIFRIKSINASIPVNLILTKKSDLQVRNQICTKKNYAPQSSLCNYEITYNKKSIEIRSNLKMNNGVIIKCEVDDCDFDYYVSNGVNFTIKNLLNFY